MIRVKKGQGKEGDEKKKGYGSSALILAFTFALLSTCLTVWEKQIAKKEERRSMNRILLLLAMELCASAVHITTNKQNEKKTKPKTHQRISFCGAEC